MVLLHKSKKLRCNECGAEFTGGEEIFSWDSAYVCCDCFDALFGELTRFERAALLGSDIVYYEDLPPS